MIDYNGLQSLQDPFALSRKSLTDPFRGGLAGLVDAKRRVCDDDPVVSAAYMH